jgi:hypothetical protein
MTNLVAVYEYGTGDREGFVYMDTPDTTRPGDRLPPAAPT